MAARRSRVLLVAGALAWVALGLLLAGRALFDRARLRCDARSPAALTGVAGTAVLGTRLTLLGWSSAGIALLVVALCIWLLLLGPVLRNWDTPTNGVSLVLTVSTESLAVLAVAIAARDGAPWLLDAALGPFLLGLALYAFVIVRFDARQLAVGRGDHWITGGALAISTLAAADLTVAATALHTLDDVRGALEALSLFLWALDVIAWLPVLDPSCGARGSATTSTAGRPSSPSACTPPAASSPEPPRTRRRSPTSLAYRSGRAPRYGWSSPPACFTAACSLPAGSARSLPRRAVNADGYPSIPAGAREPPSCNDRRTAYPGPAR